MTAVNHLLQFAKQTSLPEAFADSLSSFNNRKSQQTCRNRATAPSAPPLRLFGETPVRRRLALRLLR